MEIGAPGLGQKGSRGKTPRDKMASDSLKVVNQKRRSAWRLYYGRVTGAETPSNGMEV